MLKTKDVPPAPAGGHSASTFAPTHKPYRPVLAELFLIRISVRSSACSPGGEDPSLADPMKLGAVFHSNAVWESGSPSVCLSLTQCLLTQCYGAWGMGPRAVEAWACRPDLAQDLQLPVFSFNTTKETAGPQGSHAGPGGRCSVLPWSPCLALRWSCCCPCAPPLPPAPPHHSAPPPHLQLGRAACLPETWTSWASPCVSITTSVMH